MGSVASSASTASSSTKRPEVLVGLQYARGVAALIVAATHAVVHPFLSGPGSSPDMAHLLARFGVTLFFVISGFIMVLTTGSGRFDPIVFMRRRITRIAPLYYVATAMVVVLLLLLPKAFKTTAFDLTHIIKSLLFIPAYEPLGSGSIHPTLRLGWTLQYEMLFYLVFACCWMLDLRQRAVALTLLFGSLITIGLFVKFDNAIMQFYVQIDTLAFIAGVWLAVLVRGVRMPDLETGLARAMLAAALVSSIGMAVLYGGIRENPWTQVWLVGICCIVIWALLSQRTEPRGLIGRFFRASGDASYSIYLFHMFAVGAVTYVAKLLPSAFMPLMIIASAASGIAIGFVAHRYVEQPLNRMFHRRPLGLREGEKSSRQASRA